MGNGTARVSRFQPEAIGSADAMAVKGTKRIVIINNNHCCAGGLGTKPRPALKA